MSSDVKQRAFQPDRLHSVGVVVQDIDRATRRYAEIFGMDNWHVRDLGSGELTDVVVDGRPVEAPRLRIATATSEPPTDEGWGGTGEHNTPVSFELVEAVGGESIFMNFRFVRRQGISHLKLAEVTEEQFGELQDEFADLGMGVAASMTIDGRVRRHFFDTRRALGGYYVEVDVVIDPTAPQLSGEVVDQSGTYTRPADTEPVPIYGVNHFGIVVDDVMESIKRYRDVFGIEAWTIRDWRTEEGSLECPFYRGEPVDHEYLTALAMPFLDFGLEIIQPTHGPSHYNREFHDRWGEGIHHMLLNMSTDAGGWERTKKWLESIDVPLVMGGNLMSGDAEFGYYDTTEALGGYILEAFLLKGQPQIDPDAPTTDFTIDFAALTSQL